MWFIKFIIIAFFSLIIFGEILVIINQHARDLFIDKCKEDIEKNGFDEFVKNAMSGFLRNDLILFIVILYLLYFCNF